MAPFAPFESRPLLAIAVSGGRDSLALALLAQDWVVARGGRLLALTVDHGLRLESATEAARVSAWLAARGIDHETLRWQHERPPAAGLQEAARRARYRLLAERCARDGILHLLLAHQADDQAETVGMRLLRGSGSDGLAGMAACLEWPGVRILRPLLDVPRETLAATLLAAGQAWIEDPSNSDPRFERVRLRTAPPAPADGLRETAAAMARLRQVHEAAVCRALAALASVHPLGAVLLDAAALSALPERLGCSVIARVLTTVGGRDYPPRGAPLARLVADLRRNASGGPSGRARDRSLAGCRLLLRGGAWVVARQQRGILDAGEAAGGATEGGVERPWDGRFRIFGGTVRALGRHGWSQHREHLAARWPVAGLPVIAEALPAIEGRLHPSAVFRPRQALGGAGFFPCFAADPAQMLE